MKTVVVECFQSVPSLRGPQEVWLARLWSASEWSALLKDPDWVRIVEDQRRPFGLMTVSGDPAPGLSSWSDFADYCVQRQIVWTVSWSPNTTLLDDAFDWAGVVREVDGLPGVISMTAWISDLEAEPLTRAFDFFLGSTGSDLRRDDDDADSTDWVAIVLVIGSAEMSRQLRDVIQATAVRQDTA